MFKIRNIFLILVLLTYFFFCKSLPTFASTIFQENTFGPIGQTWNVQNLTFTGTSPSIYNVQGIIGTTNNFQPYVNTSISSHDTIVKWGMKFNGNPTAIIDCRMSLDDHYEQRVAFNSNGTVSIDSWPNGGTSPHAFDNSNGLHDFELDCIGNEITLKEDGNTIFNANPSWDGTLNTGENNQEFRILIGDTITTYTYLQLCDLNGCDPLTPPQTSLPVPLIKQTDPSWKNETYDLANLWSPTDDTIGTWGCALTSATMVLNYYNITNLPGFGNTPLNPFTLGEWLDTQPDGYIPNGNINWLAIARLSKLAKTNNSTLLDALEYKRSNFADTTTLLADLNANHPDILEEPGHFVVATGQSGSTYTINDPYYNRTDLTSYGNTFLSLGRFAPSFTDLSYILFTADPSLTITLKDSNNNPIGTSYLQQPLNGAETGLIAGNPIQLLYLEQPASSSYTLTVSGSSNQLYTLKGFLYDKDGNVKPFTQAGVTGPNNQNTITVNFDNQNLANDATQKQITITTFLDDLTTLYNMQQIKKGGYESLKALGQTIQKDVQKHNTLATKINLGVLKTLLGVDKKIGLLTDTAYQILMADIQYLQNH